MILLFALNNLDNNITNSKSLLGLAEQEIWNLYYKANVEVKGLVLLNETNIQLNIKDLKEYEFDNWYYYVESSVEPERELIIKLRKMFREADIISFSKESILKQNKRNTDSQFLIDVLDFNKNYEVLSSFKNKTGYYKVPETSIYYSESDTKGLIHLIEDIELFNQTFNDFKSCQKELDSKDFRMFKDIYEKEFFRLFPSIESALINHIHDKQLKILITSEEVFFSDYLVSIIEKYRSISLKTFDFDDEYYKRYNFRNELIRATHDRNILLRNFDMINPDMANAVFEEVDSGHRNTVVITAREYKLPENHDDKFITIPISLLNWKTKPVFKLLILIISRYHLTFGPSSGYYSVGLEKMVKDINVSQFPIMYKTIKELRNRQIKFVLNHELFWYYFRLILIKLLGENKNNEILETQNHLEKTKTPAKRYYFEKQKDTWIINFGFNEPFYFQRDRGLYYICYILSKRKDSPIPLDDIYLKTVANSSRSKKKTTIPDNLRLGLHHNMMKAIRDVTILKIRAYETKWNNRDYSLSKYLENIRTQKGSIIFDPDININWEDIKVYKIDSDELTDKDKTLLKEIQRNSA